MPTESTPALKTIRLDGADLAYLEQGRGEPVIFIHGSFSDHRAWENQRPTVARDYRYIALDMRYFGATPWADEGERFSPQTHVADLTAFIEALDLAPAHLVGRSYGSAIALATAVRSPHLVRSLFLNEPPVAALVAEPAAKSILAGELASFGQMVTSASGRSPAQATELFYDWVNDQPGAFAALPEAAKIVPLANTRTVPAQLAAPLLPITCEQVAALDIPIAITYGASTRPFFQVLARAAHDCASHSDLICIPGARHAAPSEQPEAFNLALTRFLGHCRR